MRSRQVLLALLCVVAASPQILAQEAPAAEVRRTPSPALTHSAEGSVYGWQLMTQEERAAVQARLRAARTPEEAARIRRENHAAMQARARERGVVLPPPPATACGGSADDARNGVGNCGERNGH